MSVAEYITVFVSIIVGLAIADLLISFHRLLRAGRGVQWHWLPPVVALYMLLVTANFWWGWWGSYHWYEQASSVTLAQFLPTLALIVLLFLMTAASLPDEVPASGLDLKAWYVGNARQLWALNALVLLTLSASLASGQIRSMESAATFLADEWANLAMAAGAVVLMFSRRLSLHGAYVLICLGGIIDMSFSLALRGPA